MIITLLFTRPFKALLKGASICFYHSQVTDEGRCLHFSRGWFDNVCHLIFLTCIFHISCFQTYLSHSTERTIYPLVSLPIIGDSYHSKPSLYMVVKSNSDYRYMAVVDRYFTAVEGHDIRSTSRVPGFLKVRNRLQHALLQKILVFSSLLFLPSGWSVNCTSRAQMSSPIQVHSTS